MYLFFKKRWERERRYSYYVVIFHNGKKKITFSRKTVRPFHCYVLRGNWEGNQMFGGPFSSFHHGTSLCIWVINYCSCQSCSPHVIMPYVLLTTTCFRRVNPTKNIIEGNANIFHEGKKKKPLCVCKPAFVCLNSSCDLPLTSWLCKVCNNVNIIMLTSDRLSLSLIHQSFSRRTPYSAAKQEFSIGGWKLDVEWCFGYRRLSRW